MTEAKAPEFLKRPDRGKRPYRLRCRFDIDAYPSERSLEKAKFAAAEMFVRDMAKQGFEYMDKHGFTMTGPFPAVSTVTLPKRRPPLASRDIMAAVMAGNRFSQPSNGNGVKTVPLITETARWSFELSGVFIHDTIVTELPG